MVTRSEICIVSRPNTSYNATATLAYYAFWIPFQVILNITSAVKTAHFQLMVHEDLNAISFNGKQRFIDKHTFLHLQGSQTPRNSPKDQHTKKAKDNITLTAKELFQTKSLKINKELCFVHTINYFSTLQLGSYNIQIHCLYLCRMLTT